MMNTQGLLENLPHAHPWIQGCMGVLKDHLHPAPKAPQLSTTDTRHVFSVEPDLPRSERMQLKHTPSKCSSHYRFRRPVRDSLLVERISSPDEPLEPLNRFDLGLERPWTHRGPRVSTAPLNPFNSPIGLFSNRPLAPLDSDAQKEASPRDMFRLPSDNEMQMHSLRYRPSEPRRNLERIQSSLFLESRQTRQEGTGIGMRRVSEQHFRGRSITCPPYNTTTRSTASAPTQTWVTKIMDNPFLDQIPQQIQNLLLNGNIERCCRLIGNQQPGLREEAIAINTR